jgi:Glycosyl hydrolase family 9/Cellulase N-terminal ig-like domain
MQIAARCAGCLGRAIGWIGIFYAGACCGQVSVLVDQVGYETHAPKQAIIAGSTEDHPQKFTLIDADTRKTIFEGNLKPAGKVYAWANRVFWIADFSAWQKTGNYALKVDGGRAGLTSCAFEVNDDILERETLSNVVFYFKGQRASGDMDAADRHLRLPGGEQGVVDAHGGWYDATGDYGIHLSHQNPTSYFNPQQVPLVAWSLLKSFRVLEARKNENFSQYERRMLDEGLYGADYLVRIKRPGGSFYETINAPGKGKLARDRAIGNPDWRTRIKLSASDSTEHIGKAEGAHAYEASFRAGGGMAIAGLALASTMPIDGEFSRSEYLRSAEDAFEFLYAHNRELLNDGVENILDDYCALMAATELYTATREDRYRSAADERAEKLMARLTTQGRWRDYWRADDGTRPFFHPSDAGLPVISLLEYAEIASAENRAKALDTVERSLRFELAVTAEVNNPFGYARQLVRTKGETRTAFFFPHDTEAAPWWQGENARLASLAAAARMAEPYFNGKPDLQAQLRTYAWNQLHWILGRNPFDASMLMGSGHGYRPYMFFRSYEYTGAPGGIMNGITAGLDNEDGIAFNLGYATTGKDEDWRWTEQWLPHAAWYLYAVSLPH